jgi:hypothetical protein
VDIQGNESVWLCEAWISQYERRRDHREKRLHFHVFTPIGESMRVIACFGLSTRRSSENGLTRTF